MSAETTESPLGSSDRIRAVALQLFARKGYDATSVREICDAAGVTKPTLYHFYGSKEGVYRAIVDGAFGMFLQRLSELVAPPGTAAERLHRVGRDYCAMGRDHRELMRFIIAIVHNPPSDAPPIPFPAFYESSMGIVERIVEQGVCSGEFRPGRTDLRMLAFFGAFGEALVGNLVMGRPELSDELGEALVDTVIEGWRTR